MKLESQFREKPRGFTEFEKIQIDREGSDIYIYFFTFVNSFILDTIENRNFEKELILDIETKKK